MGTYEATISMLQKLPEGDLLKVKAYVSRFFSASAKESTEDTGFYPYKPLTREEIVSELENARVHAENGQVMDAHQASQIVREKYGL